MVDFWDNRNCPRSWGSLSYEEGVWRWGEERRWNKEAQSALTLLLAFLECHTKSSSVLGNRCARRSSVLSISFFTSEIINTVDVSPTRNTRSENVTQLRMGGVQAPHFRNFSTKVVLYYQKNFESKCYRTPAISASWKTNFMFESTDPGAPGRVARKILAGWMIFGQYTWGRRSLLTELQRPK